MCSVLYGACVIWCVWGFGEVISMHTILSMCAVNVSVCGVLCVCVGGGVGVCVYTNSEGYLHDPMSALQKIWNQPSIWRATCYCSWKRKQMN